jgi:precorrin isomerase
MKLTWFGKSVFRIYIGGRIIVADAQLAPEGIDAHELVAAADVQINLSDGGLDHPQIDENWRSSRPLRQIDQPEEVIEELYTLSGEGVFIDEPQEGPVILAPATETAWGPFANNAVVVFFGNAEGVAQEVADLLASAKPRLIVLALSGLTDEQFHTIGNLCQRFAVQVLEEGLALEA